MNALKKANEAASAAFDRYLDAMHATATQYVPESVIDAAQAAYTAAGGKRRIKVCGRGNLSHPVCSVYVRISE